MNNIFTLESETYGYDTSWELEWCGNSFRQAIEERNILIDKYKGYERFRITVWIDGKKNVVFYFIGRKEVKENEFGIR